MYKAVAIRSLALGLSVIGPCVIGLAGCASNDGMAEINVHCDQTDERYVDTFDRALFTEAKDGQVDLILLAGGNELFDQNQSFLSAPDGHVNTGMKQVIHLRVLWQPTRTIKLDSPSATNAAIDWHVFTGEKDKVSYTGSCWAMVNVDGDEAKIDLRNATVTVNKVQGNVQDPLKRASLQGKFTATRSDAVVRSYLNDLALDHSNATALLAPPLAQVVP